MRAFVDPPAASAFGYVRGSKVALVASIVAIAFVPDALFTWLVVPARFWFLRVLCDVAGAYAAVWSFGLYGAMVAMPHELRSDAFVANEASLRRAVVPLAVIASVDVAGARRRRELKRAEPGAAVMSFGGVPLVRIRTREPVVVDGWGRAAASVLFVASDDPVALQTLLRGAISASKKTSRAAT